MFYVSVQGEAAARPTRLGRYELITKIGHGGMAEVQLALQRGPGGFEKLVVVKLVHDGLATQKAFVDMLLDEARVAALVKHPNVVDIYDLGEVNGRFFIAMEYLEGEPLLAVLRAGREGKRLDPLSMGRLIADTAEGLDAAHELRSMSGERIELVHHDISLGNIVVLYNGQVKLVDFGVAKATQTAAVSGAKVKVQGKFSYMAPEKLKGAHGDRRSDIFSLGCVMWEALTLKRLFRGNNDAETMRQVLDRAIQPPSKVNAEVPSEFDPIVMRALDRDPSRRQLTAKELAVEIEELLRKRGYGAKNDKIARYMQETFGPHIDARKKLVHEVVAQGSASAEMVDAAFNDTVLEKVPLGMLDADFLQRFSPSGTSSPSSGVPLAASGPADASQPTEISESAFDHGTVTDFNSSLAVSLEDADVMPPPPSGLFAALLRDPRKRVLAIGGAGALVIVIVVLVVALARGGKAGDRLDKNAAWSSSAGSDTEVAHAGSASWTAGSGSAGTPSDNAMATTDGSGSAIREAGNGSDHDIVMDPQGGSASKHPHSNERPKHPTATTIVATSGHPTAPTTTVATSAHPTVATAATTAGPETAEGLYAKGLAAYNHGDNDGALAALTKAKTLNGKYPDTYRVLGFVYERMGNKGQAKLAYLRYLGLKPNAPDADPIRKRLEKIL
jgi:serine/threonine-protein kinase